MTGVTAAAMTVVLHVMATLVGDAPNSRVGYSADDIFCLAQNTYFEARNQTVEGQLAVAFVTINRVKSQAFPDTICEVVWQRRQFSWTHDGKTDIIPYNRIEDGLWDAIIRTTVRALSPFTDDPTNGSLFYHAEYVRPDWVSDIGMHAVLRIDDHIFYRRRRR